MGCIGTFVNCFKDSENNDINAIPDLTKLSAEQWSVVPPEYEKILKESDQKILPELVKKLCGVLGRKFEKVLGLGKQGKSGSSINYGRIEGISSKNHKEISNDERDGK